MTGKPDRFARMVAKHYRVPVNVAMEYCDTHFLRAYHRSVLQLVQRQQGYVNTRSSGVVKMEKGLFISRNTLLAALKVRAK